MPKNLTVYGHIAREKAAFWVPGARGSFAMIRGREPTPKRRAPAGCNGSKLAVVTGPRTARNAMRARVIPRSAGSTETDLVVYLKQQIDSLQTVVREAEREASQNRVEAAIDSERLRGEMKLLTQRGEHEREMLQAANNRRIEELQDRQARDGIDFILKNRTISARGAMEWAEREIRRKRFPGERPERRQIWSYAVGSSEALRECLEKLGWEQREVSARMVDLYGKISGHIHDRHSPEMTATHPIIVLEEGTGDGFLTAAEAGAIKCVCRVFRLSYDAYKRDPKDGNISSEPDTFRALSDEQITKAAIDFYSQMEADAAAARAKKEQEALSSKNKS